MGKLTRETAETIIKSAIEKGRSMGLKPLAVAVLDPRGALKAFVAEDGTSLMRAEMAQGKAWGALAIGAGSRWLHEQAETRVHFVSSLTTTSGGRIVPAPGGVLIKDGAGEMLGAVGISGDTSDNDEAAAVAGIEAVGLVAVID